MIYKLAITQPAKPANLFINTFPAGCTAEFEQSKFEFEFDTK